MSWKCDHCTTRKLDYLYKKSGYNGNKDDTHYCERCWIKSGEEAWQSEEVKELYDTNQESNDQTGSET